MHQDRLCGSLSLSCPAPAPPCLRIKRALCATVTLSIRWQPHAGEGHEGVFWQHPRHLQSSENVSVRARSTWFLHVCAVLMYPITPHPQLLGVSVMQAERSRVITAQSHLVSLVVCDCGLEGPGTFGQECRAWAVCVAICRPGCSGMDSSSQWAGMCPKCVSNLLSERMFAEE